MNPMFRAALLLLSASLALFPQGRMGPAGRPPGGAEPFRGPGGGHRGMGPGAHQIVNRLHHLHVQRLQSQVGLSEERSRVVADRWRSYNLDWMERGQRSIQLRQQFNQVLIGPGSDEEKTPRLKPLVEEFFALRKQQIELKQKFEEEIRSGLSSAQQVRLILLVDELHRELLQGIREAAQP